MDVQNPQGKFLLVGTDHIGSIITLADERGTQIEERNFDAWGRARNPKTLEYLKAENINWITNRGFTGHEHLFEFGLIHMNGRVYDPVLGRMLSPDNYVQDATFSQSFNRYSYCWNNPLKYTDPSGEFIATTLAAALCPPLLPMAIYFDFFTETGYDLQKYLSPVALHVDVNLGTHKSGVGVDASFGVPQSFWVSARGHGGISYNWENYGVTPGWETRYGAEVGISPWAVVGFTHYNSPGDKFDQTLGELRLGVPFVNVKYANDWFFDTPLGDNGDRYRTAAAKIQLGLVDIGINLFTGDPGKDTDDRNVDYTKGGKGGQYIKSRNGDDPDEFRFGVGYIGIGPVRFGNDKESRRHNIQNVLVHDKITPLFGEPSPWFKYDNKKKNSWYFQFGGGGGLW